MRIFLITVLVVFAVLYLRTNTFANDVQANHYVRVQIVDGI